MSVPKKSLERLQGSLLTSDRLGKTTIARLIAQTAGTRFVEINSTSSGVAECKKLFAEAQNEKGLTGRKTIIFCEYLHFEHCFLLPHLLTVN